MNCSTPCVSSSNPLRRNAASSLHLSPPRFQCSDRRLLRRLLQNLISNAVKYTSRGKVLVGCRRHGGRVVVEVHDTGLGIPASKQKAIFLEFHRLDEGMRAAKGLGLGLSIVERIRPGARSPGHLALAQWKGILLCGRAADRGSTARRLWHLNSAPAPGQLDGLLVLAIDNEPNILDGMRRLLESWNCRAIKLLADDVEAAEKIAEVGGLPTSCLSTITSIKAAHNCFDDSCGRAAGLAV